MLATLLLSQGVPMMLAGDECRRTQQGNNNAYCQDNEISWFNWKLVEKNADLVRFVQALIAFRKSNPTVRRIDFLKGMPDRPGLLPDVSWFAANGKTVDWHANDASLTCLFGAPDVDEDPERRGRHVMLLVHAGHHAARLHHTGAGTDDRVAEIHRHFGTKPRRHLPRGRRAATFAESTRALGGAKSGVLRGGEAEVRPARQTARHLTG